MQEQDNSGNGNGSKPIVEIVKGELNGMPPKKANAQVEFMQRKKKQITHEFKQWKKQLIEMIKSGSRLVPGPNHSYQFLLPPALVKLVWSTTIQERARYQEQVLGLEPEEAVKVAVEGLRKEVTEAQAELQTAEDEKAKIIEQANHPVLKLSQLILAWEIMHDDKGDRAHPVGLNDLGKSLNKAGVRVLNDQHNAPQVIQEYRRRKKQKTEMVQTHQEVLAASPATPSKTLTPEEEAEEQKAAESLAKTREELVKGNN